MHSLAQRIGVTTSPRLYRTEGDKLLWLWTALVALGALCLVWPLWDAIRKSEWVQYGIWLGIVLVIEVIVLAIDLLGLIETVFPRRRRVAVLCGVRV